MVGEVSGDRETLHAIHACYVSLCTPNNELNKPHNPPRLPSHQPSPSASPTLRFPPVHSQIHTIFHYEPRCCSRSYHVCTTSHRPQWDYSVITLAMRKYHCCRAQKYSVWSPSHPLHLSHPWFHLSLNHPLSPAPFKTARTTLCKRSTPYS
jgi:hypothetical protein